MTTGKALFMTIGTGRPDNLEDSFFTPVGLSINSDTWKHVILLPSTTTEGAAREVAKRHGEVPIRVAPLPAPDLENDPDACFAHFDEQIAAVLASGISATDCVADITRGTKAMSAALALAAVRRDLPVLRYIGGERIAALHGTVKAGTENLVNARTSVVGARRRLDAARELYGQGSFAAVLTLLPDPENPFFRVVPETVQADIVAVRALAAFAAAWDRLDYQTAADLAPEAERANLPDDWAPLALPTSAFEWVRGLARDTACQGDLRANDPKAMGHHVGHLCADLIANAERRVVQAQYEDASLRVYRILELLGQARLFAYGYDSEVMPEDDPLVSAFLKRMDKKKDGRRGIHPSASGGPGLSFPRAKVASFLKTELKEPFAKGLTKLGDAESVKARNQSLLIHGFKATGPKEHDPLLANLDTLADLLRQAFPDQAAGWLERARALPPNRP